MRQVIINVYDFNELSDKAKENVRQKVDTDIYTYEAWEEWKKFVALMTPKEGHETSGLRLRKWIVNNVTNTEPDNHYMAILFEKAVDFKDDNLTLKQLLRCCESYYIDIIADEAIYQIDQDMQNFEFFENGEIYGHKKIEA